MIKNNPFYILDIPMTAPKGAVLSAAENAVLLGDSQGANDAAVTLLNPQKRLGAELGWFPGADDDLIDKIKASVKASVPVDISGLRGVTALNASVYDFTLRDPAKKAKKQREKIDQYVVDILRMAILYDHLDPESITEKINSAREAADILPATVSQVAEEISSMRSGISGEIASKIWKLPKYERLSVMNTLAYECLRYDSILIPAVIEDVFDSYEIIIHEESDRLKTLAHEYALKIKKAHAEVAFITRHWLNKYTAVLSEWVMLARPLILRSSKYNTAYGPAEELSKESTSIVICLQTEKKFSDRWTMANELMQKMARIFKDSPKLAAPYMPTPEEVEARKKVNDALAKWGIIFGVIILSGSFLMGFAFLSEGMYREFFESGLMTIVPPVVIIWLIVRYMRKKRREKEEAEAEAAGHDTSGGERKS